MRNAEAIELGKRILALVEVGEARDAYALLGPVLAQRTPFPLLQRIGEAVGAGSPSAVNVFLDRVAAERTMGGWVVIGGALLQQLDRDLVGAFERCRTYVIAADVWYATDILGERVPGPALLSHFETAISLLASWRQDENRWVRRTVGVAVHFWAKRARGARELQPRVARLLDLLEPMFEEREKDAIKGVGWGLKTLGRYYPDLVTDWLVDQVAVRKRPHRALMLRKACTYLTEEQRARLM